MKRLLCRRVERLEKNARFQPSAPDGAEDLQYWQMVEKLLLQMDAKYVTLVKEDLDGGRGRDLRQYSQLTMAVLDRALDHMEIGSPLALPAAVAEAYMANPNAGNSASCLQCRYRLPRASFRLCPLCGGLVR